MDRKIKDNEWVRVRSEDELRPPMTVKLHISGDPPHIFVLLRRCGSDLRGFCRACGSTAPPWETAPRHPDGDQWYWSFCCDVIPSGRLYRFSDSALGSTDTETTEPAPRERERVR